MKLEPDHVAGDALRVAPRAGAWIETHSLLNSSIRIGSRQKCHFRKSGQMWPGPQGTVEMEEIRGRIGLKRLEP